MSKRDGIRTLAPAELAMERYKKIAPYLQDGVPLAQLAKMHGIHRVTLHRWVLTFEKIGLSGLGRQARADKGTRRTVMPELVQLVEGLYLRNPPPSISNLHRRLLEVCARQGWQPPSYRVIRDIAKALDPKLQMLAHEGEKAYREVFDIIHRREAERANEIWQCDHTPLDILIKDANGQAIKPVLTVVIDDYSRAVPGYYISFDPPSSVRIALALRQAIWRKEESGWSVCGIPEKFYTDHGSDFMSKHIDQVAIDLKFELVQSIAGKPQGRGKIERFFETVNQMFLSRLPGYAPAGYLKTEAVLSLEELDQEFRKWLLQEYMQREHSEIAMTPKDKWESFAFLPRLPDSQEQLDLLLLTVAKPRRVQRDGIRFQSFRYFDINLAGYVGEDVTIRYDPRDLAEIFVYADNQFVCRAVCYELADKTVSLKEIIKARNGKKKELRQNLNELLAVADKHAPIQKPLVPAVAASPATQYPKFKIKRFACDDD